VQESEERTTGVISSRAKINFTFVAAKTNINLWAKLSRVLGGNLQDVYLSLSFCRQCQQHRTPVQTAEAYVRNIRLQIYQIL
jgi:hypothetical protein